MANIFSKKSNLISFKILIAFSITMIAIIIGFTYYATPKYTRVGYQPIQPVAFDHNLHVGQIGIDCRYCHNYVENSSHSNIPAASTCMNCHNQIKQDSSSLTPIRTSYESGNPVPWVRVHKLPDYVYFNHSAHVNRGVSCIDCHGAVNEMEVIMEVKSLSMDFCLNCHRNPEKFVRPIEHVYDLDWKFEDLTTQIVVGQQIVNEWNINPPQSCSGCHR